MLNDNKYYYEDKHLYFWFGDHHSSEYNLFIISKNDLKIENATGASTQYNNAMFQEGTYLLGTSRKQKTFKRKVAAEGLSLEQYKQMMLWLQEGATGFLSFDSNPWWGWTVVLETTADATVNYATNGLIVELELTWKTVGSYLAINRYESMGINQIVEFGTEYALTNSNPYGIPAFFQIESDLAGYKWYEVVNIGNINQQVDYNCTFNANSFNIGIMQGSDFMAYATVHFTPWSQPVELEYHGSSGFIFVDGQLAEEHANFIQSSQTRGLISLTGPTPMQIHLNDFDWESLQNIGYSYIVEVSPITGQALWSNTQYPSVPANIAGQEATLQSSVVRIYSTPSEIREQAGYEYYAISASRLAITDSVGTPIIYSYNNL
jgi:hypothetical protein